MGMCAVQLIFFAALVCFKACLAQDVLVSSAQNPGYETTIWTEQNLEDNAGDFYYSLKPTASAAVISSNLLLTLEESPVPVPATPATVHSPTLLQIDLFKPNNISGFRRLTKVNFTSLASDATAPKIAIYKVEPAFMQGLRPVNISASKPNATDMCTMSIWKKDNLLYTVGKTVSSDVTTCPGNIVGIGNTTHFCTTLQLSSDTEYNSLKLLEGGLLICNGQLAGLSFSQVPAVRDRRYFLDLVPFRERIEKVIIDNVPVMPGNSANGATSTVLCVVFAAFVAISSSL